MTMSTIAAMDPATRQRAGEQVTDGGAFHQLGDAHCKKRNALRERVGGGGQLVEQRDELGADLRPGMIL
jgi:hypothetical protein